MVTKALPPPASDTGPGPADDAQDAAKVDQVIQLLTPVNGAISQENHDKAMALLGELKVALGGTADAPAEPAAPAQPPPAKGISVGHDVAALIAEIKALTAALARREFGLPEETENDALEAAFASPEVLNELRTQLG